MLVFWEEEDISAVGIESMMVERVVEVNREKTYCGSEVMLFFKQYLWDPG